MMMRMMMSEEEEEGEVKENCSLSKHFKLTGTGGEDSRGGRGGSW